MSPSSTDRRAEQRTEWTTSERLALAQSSRRRRVLGVLTDGPDGIDVEQLAAIVAARENDVDDPAETTVDLVAASLHHVHLPKLAEAGVLDYDAEAHVVTADPSAIEALTPYDLPGD